MTLNGVQTALQRGADVPQTAKINTGQNSSVVLIFSNGAQTQLAADSELVIEEFLQDPLKATLAIAETEDEPTVSRTTLALNRGELTGHVKHLQKDKGSAFTVKTPVGAAGIRGTTFRIVFRPTGNGQAYTFTLTTQVGDVGFTPAGGNTAGTPTPGGTPDPATATVTGTGSGTGLSIPQGQEIVMVVDVATNAQGQQVVTVIPPPPPPTPAPQTTITSVTNVAVEVAVAVQNTVFTPAPPAANPSGGTGTGGGGGSGTGGGAPPSGTVEPGVTGTVTGTSTTPGGTTTTTATIGGTTTGGQTVTAEIKKTTPPPAEPPRIITTNPNP